MQNSNPNHTHEMHRIEQVIFNTRAQYDQDILRLWQQVQRIENNKILIERLKDRLEDYIEDARAHPPVVNNQPGIDSNVWQGAYDLGTTTDSHIPCRFDVSQFQNGGVSFLPVRVAAEKRRWQ